MRARRAVIGQAKGESVAGWGNFEYVPTEPGKDPSPPPIVRRIFCLLWQNMAHVFTIIKLIHKKNIEIMHFN